MALPEWNTKVESETEITPTLSIKSTGIPADLFKQVVLAQQAGLAQTLDATIATLNTERSSVVARRDSLRIAQAVERTRHLVTT
ncbi:hypothetical protein IMW82_09495 [Rhodanobacter sp. B2A1Ga4]|uniref:hypothetical protein n=1 Tax=Rhodanobacter TaxID=75309 RepID=UPI00131F1B6B|nr:MULTISPECIES: hypothetical protein [Rhodanobacter]MBQ4854901.1 hypothetical protein [Rhodanobacter sp. B2A1Ga4]